MRLVRLVSWVLVFVAIGTAAATWFTPRVELEEDDAVQLAIDALADVGLEATVTDPAILAPYLPAEATDDADTIEAWVVYARVGDDVIELRIDDRTGRLAYLDDRIGADRQDQLLTEAQYEQVSASGPGLADWVRRGIAATVAAVLVAGTGSFLAKRSGRLVHAARPVSAIG